MRILVYGAGAIGCYLGGHLLRADHEVVLVTRQPAVKALNENGLTVETPDERFQVWPQAVSSVHEAVLGEAPFDAILLTMKSYDLEEALRLLFASCPHPPPLIVLQNGIGLEEVVLSQVGGGEVIAASLTTPISRETPERVASERSDRGLALAPTAADQTIAPWSELFENAGVTTLALPDYRAMKWSKALLNMIANASAAILNRHPGDIYKHRPTFEIEMDMLKETLAVMKRLDLKVVDLPGTPTTRLALALRFVPRFLTQAVLSGIVAGGRGNKMPSFQLDLVAGRRNNEVLYHNVAVAEAGKQAGVHTPVNAALGQTLLGIVQGAIDWSEFQDKPERLVTEVELYRQT